MGKKQLSLGKIYSWYLLILFKHTLKYVEFHGDVDFICFRPEISFLGISGSKNQSCQFKLKFTIKSISYMQKLMVMLTFFVFNRKYHFWANLIPKFKIVSLG